METILWADTWDSIGNRDSDIGSGVGCLCALLLSDPPNCVAAVQNTQVRGLAAVESSRVGNRILKSKEQDIITE